MTDIQRNAAEGRLAISGITKAFGASEAPVLDGIALDIAGGEFVSLIGPSGCGKTTLLRIVAGLLQPSNGMVELDGRPSLEPSREKGVVFQHFNLFPWRRTLANTAYGLELQRVPKAERAERARKFLALVGLSRYEQHYPGQISGGMKQRVGIARALAIEPKVLLMDEPFGALDALTRERLQQELESITSTRKLTTLFVTHSLDEALFLSDRIVVMGARPGRILEVFDVPFDRPRAAHDIRADPEYAMLRAELWRLLETELEKAELEAEASGS